IPRSQRCGHTRARGNPGGPPDLDPGVRRDDVASGSPCTFVKCSTCITRSSGLQDDTKMTHICDLTIQGGLLFLIIFTPLAFGSVYPWGIALMEGTVLLMALAWVFKLLHTERLRLVRTPFNLPILLFLGLMVLQLLPLPPLILYFVSPNTY